MHAHPQRRAGDGGGDERRLLLAMLLTAGFMVVEVAGGVFAGSLALLADAGHMLTDTAALSFAWLASRVGRRPADSLRSFGYHRFEVLAAFVNGAVVLAVAAWIAYEAVRRLSTPVPVMGGVMVAVAVLGLAVNVAAFLVLHRSEEHNLNLRGAALHVLGDLLGSAAAIVAGTVILLTGWMPIDPLLSVLVAALILRSAWTLLRHSGHILLEGTPDDIDVAELRSAIERAVPEVDDVHHVHAWSLTPERRMMTLHAHVGDGADQERVLHGIRQCLLERYGIFHATVQIERGRCADERPGAPAGS